MLFWGGGEGGDAAATIELARALIARGVNVKLAAYCLSHKTEFRKRAEAAGLRIDKDFFLIDNPEEVWKQTALKSSDFDLMHVQHGRTIPKRTDIMPLRKAAEGLPVFITAHGPLPLDAITYGGWKSRLSRWISPVWFKAIVVPSEAKKREWKKLTPFGRKVVAIPNVVPFLEQHDNLRARERLGIPLDAEVVLFCSRLDEEKDPFTFIRAISEMRKQRQNVIGVMAGSGALAWKCLALVSELNAPIKTLGYRSDLDWVYSAADVFVQPSLYESFCITVLHAAQMGLPCVATNLTVLKEFYGDSSLFRWFEAGDVTACAAAINQTLKERGDPSTQLRTGRKEERGSEMDATLRERFSENRIVDAHLQLWSKAVRK